MPLDVTTEIEIARPVDEVADFAADPANAPAWYVNIASVRWESAPAVEVGARVAFVATFLGRTLAYTYEIREYEPRRLLVMSTREGPFPMETTYRWSATEAGTRMSLRNRGAPQGFRTVLAPLMSPAVRRANRKDLAALKRLLEARPQASGTGS